MRRTHVFAASLTALLLAAAPQTAPPAPTAAEILQRVAGVYANCKSYRDAGVVEATICPAELVGVVHPDEQARSRILRLNKPFRTAFVRPGRFRFEFSDHTFKPPTRYIVWEDGEQVRTWWTLGSRLEAPGSLVMAIAGATGVSGGSAHTIPRLLMPMQVSGAAITADLVGATRLDDATLDDVPCLRVQGTLGKSEHTLWIDAASFLVRRIDRRSVDAKQVVTQTTTYEPELDVEIGDGELAFDAPTK